MNWTPCAILAPRYYQPFLGLAFIPRPEQRCTDAERLERAARDLEALPEQERTPSQLRQRRSRIVAAIAVKIAAELDELLRIDGILCKLQEDNHHA